MFSILLITHGKLGVAFHHTLEHIMGGPQEKVLAFEVKPDEDIEKCRASLTRTLQ
ncbi:MAG: hypothetical protein COC23_04755, partial [Hyphomicrobiales bacterium]